MASYRYVRSSLSDPTHIELLVNQTFIRSVFITFSSAALFFLIRYYVRKLEVRAHEYQKLFYENPHAMWVFDPITLRFLAVNQAAVAHYGYTESEFLQMTIRDIRPREEWNRLDERLQQVRDKEGFYHSGTWLHQRKDGSIMNVEIATHVIEWNSKRAELILVNDVTEKILAENKIMELNASLERKVDERTYQLAKANEELYAMNEEMTASNEELLSLNEQLYQSNETIRHQADQLVEQSEEKLNSILATLNDAVYTMERRDGYFKPFFVNDAIQKIYGRTQKEFLANDRLWFDQVYPADQPVLEQALERIQVMDYAECEYRIVHSSGALRWVLNRGWKEHTEGIETRINGIITDITVRKEFELQLATQKELLQKVFDNIPVMVSLTDSNRRYVFVNKVWEHTMGWTHDEALREDIFSAVLPDKKYREKALANAPRDGNSWYDIRLTTKKGHELETTWISLPLADGNVISFGLDITEEKKRDREKSTLLRQLVEQNNNLTQFSFIASHNLRGPVASILGLISILDEDKIGSAHNKLVLHNLHSVAHRLDEVIKDLSLILDIRAHQKHAKEWVGLADVVGEIRQSLLQQIADANPLWEENYATLDKIYTIKSYIQSILYNLIANALKYRSPDRALKIKIQSFQEAARFGFMVEDNGIGIDLEKYGSKLFTLYQRFHFEQEGKGLGLFLVKTQVETLKGKITVESTPGGGTRFVVTFPTENASVEEDEDLVPVFNLRP